MFDLQEVTCSSPPLPSHARPPVQKQIVFEDVQAARSAEPAEVVTEGLRELDDVAQRRVDFDQHPLPFNDVKEAFEGQTTGQLLRSLGVLSACQFRPLVRNADNLLKTSKKLFGSTLVNFGVRHTFFKQFCGGESMSGCLSFLAFLVRGTRSATVCVLAGISIGSAKVLCTSQDGNLSRSK